jgi:DNA-cytosine methyltransferase
MLDLFSGIGGFSYAAQQVWGDDLEIVSFVEIDPFCQKILRKHWPDVPIVEDIKDVTEKTMADHFNKRLHSRGRGNDRDISQEGRGRGINKGRSRTNVGVFVDTEKNERLERRIHLLTGGFPCQPASVAGKRQGKADDRWLWPEMFRTIRTFKPTWVIAENVYGLLTLDGGMVFEHCCFDLESEGYEVQPFVIPACATNAPHRRDRVWIVAHAQRNNDQRNSGTVQESDEQTSEKRQEKRVPESGSTSQCRQDVADTGDCRLQGLQEQGGDEAKWEKSRNQQSERCGRGREMRSTQPRLGEPNDGLSDKLVGGINGKKKNGRSEKELPILRESSQAEKVSEQVGGSGSIQKTKVLQSKLHGKILCQRCAIKREIITCKGKKIPWELLRNLWGGLLSGGASHRRESFQQLTREYPDLMREMSRYPSPPCPSCWADGSWEDDIPRVARGIPDRVNKLKALGNAILPQLAMVLMSAIKEVESANKNL